MAKLNDIDQAVLAALQPITGQSCKVLAKSLNINRELVYRSLYKLSQAGLARNQKYDALNTANFFSSPGQWVSG